MKKLLLISLLSFFFSGNSEAQGKSKNSFVEWNFGVAYLEDWSSSSSFFPGTSVLWGRTHINDNNFIFEYEAGLALPSIVTGKLGIGKKFNKISNFYSVNVKIDTTFHTFLGINLLTVSFGHPIGF